MSICVIVYYYKYRYKSQAKSWPLGDYWRRSGGFHRPVASLSWVYCHRWHRFATWYIMYWILQLCRWFLRLEKTHFQSRGSGNPTTGPAMDSSSDRATAGGYAFIDSSFPRRPGDTAKLISSSFPATSADMPMCMHFWFHMFGSGIGYLKLFLRHFRSSDSQEIWSLSGNAGNAWFMSQVTISSLDDFQLIFEASVGNTGMGDIAIDDISYGLGACPGMFLNRLFKICRLMVEN